MQSDLRVDFNQNKASVEFWQCQNLTLISRVPQTPAQRLALTQEVMNWVNLFTLGILMLLYFFVNNLLELISRNACSACMYTSSANEDELVFNSESVAILYGEKKRQSMGLPDILIVATVDKELNG